MDDFKKKIQFRCHLCTIFFCLHTLIFAVLKHATQNISDYSQGMIFGIFVALDMAVLLYMLKCISLLKNEKKLKEEYIKATDERNIAIAKETTRTATMISIMCTGLAILITGFFSRTVSITLTVDLIAGALITALVYAYYNKKM